MSKKLCRCDLCNMGRRIRKAIKNRDHDEMAAIIDELDELWCNAEFDRDYYKAIIDGSWPQAEEILIKSLKKAKKFKEKNNAT